MIFSVEEEVNEMHERVFFLMKDRDILSGEISAFVAPNASVPNFFSKWSKNRTGITLKRAFLAAEVLDTSLDYLLLGRGSSIRKSNVYSNILSIDEKDLFVSYKNLNNRDRDFFLSKLKVTVPKNAFFEADLVKQCHGDYEMVDAELTKLLADFGPKLKALLKEKQIRQKSLSEFCNIDPALMNRYLKGLRIIPVEKLIAVCQILEVFPSELLFPETEPKTIQGFSEKDSELIVYYRMLTMEERGRQLAFIRAIQKDLIL